MKQVIHYSAHGSGGLTFDCYHAEMQRHLDSKYVVTPEPIPGQWSAPEDHYSIRPPRGHTDLRRVTCLDCWRSIRGMAHARLTRGTT